MLDPVQPAPPANQARAAANPSSAIAPASGSSATPANPNPTYELDPALGLVVIQYRSEAGKVDLSIPSAQQLDAYAADPASLTKKDATSVVA